VPTPTLPLPTPTLPLSTPAPTASPTPGSSGPPPSPTPRPSDTPASSLASGGSSSSPPGGGGSDQFTVRPVDLGAADALLGVGFNGFDLGIDWVVPGLALTVPGLLLILAILAQGVIGAVSLPYARRWLGGVGVRPR
jgi:hypothetical protein